VITGFRWSPGGAQVRYGITPDITTMAKIVAGGMPGGAVGGKRDVMDVLIFKDEPGWNSQRKVRHQGTYNASPVVSAAGATCLRKAADPAVQQYCDGLAAQLRVGMNGALVERNLPGYVWGESSVFHLRLGEAVPNQTGGDIRVPEGVSATDLKNSGHGTLNDLAHLGMMIEGVELFHSGGMTSTVHTPELIDETVGAFGRVLDRMVDEGAWG
jgi:glutamate-1-semialdehyde 2,1-aminomutase